MSRKTPAMAPLNPPPTVPIIVAKIFDLPPFYFRLFISAIGMFTFVSKFLSYSSNPNP